MPCNVIPSRSQVVSCVTPQTCNVTASIGIAEISQVIQWNKYVLIRNIAMYNGASPAVPRVRSLVPTLYSSWDFQLGEVTSHWEIVGLESTVGWLESDQINDFG